MCSRAARLLERAPGRAPPSPPRPRAGSAGSPSRVAVRPSFIAPLPESVRSSSWTITGRPKSVAYWSARRIRPAFITGRPSSVMQTQPAAHQLAHLRQLLALEALGDGARRVHAAEAAPRGRAADQLGDERAVVDRLGVGHGHHRGEAARHRRRQPVRIVSLPSSPGSRRCTCRSMKPGSTQRPARVHHLARPARCRGASDTSATLPSRTSTSRTPSTPLRGSMTPPAAEEHRRALTGAPPPGWPGARPPRWPPAPG